MWPPIFTKKKNQHKPYQKTPHNLFGVFFVEKEFGGHYEPHIFCGKSVDNLTTFSACVWRIHTMHCPLGWCIRVWGRAQSQKQPCIRVRIPGGMQFLSQWEW